jgi:sugar lactone lactonase YvrE
MKSKSLAALGSSSARVAALCGALLSLGHAGSAAASPPVEDCEEPVLEQVASFDPALGQLPESMTADEQGNLFVSTVGGAVFQLTPQHSVSQVATVVLPTGGQLTGIKVGPDGLLYISSASFTADPPAAIVWRVNPRSGEFAPFATLDPNGFPNDLVFDRDGNLLVSDPFLAQIWQIDPRGQASVWLSDPLLAGDPAAPAFVGVHAFGVDGLAFDAQKRDLYIGNVDFGRVLVSSPQGGQRGRRLSVLVEDPALKGIDGIALDRSGTVYAAVNTQNRLATVDRQGRVQILTEGGLLDSPSSFAFGTGRSDLHTLYVANFAIISFLTGQPANPGVLSLSVRVPGTPLL